jgi:hypothetical protein
MHSNVHLNVTELHPTASNMTITVEILLEVWWLIATTSVNFAAKKT